MHKQQNYQIPFLRQVGSIGFVPRTKVRFLKCIQQLQAAEKAPGRSASTMRALHSAAGLMLMLSLLNTALAATYNQPCAKDSDCDTGTVPL